jgi:hypothetical protein
MIPAEPPYAIVRGKSLSPISRATSSTDTSSASAAIWVSVVEVPVPMSEAPSSTV